MSNRARQIVLEHKNETLSIQGDSSVQSDFYITDEGIEGWFSNPTAKVSASERTTGDGTHKVLESGVLYNSRTVTFSTYVLGEDRTAVVNGIKKLLYFSKKIIRIYVYDAEDCTYCDGYAKWCAKILCACLSRSPEVIWSLHQIQREGCNSRTQFWSILCSGVSRAS